MAASSFASGESARFVTTILRWRLILVELPGGRAVDLSAAPAFNRSPVALEHCKLGRRFFPAMSQHSKPTFGPPLIATATAAAGLIAMLLVDHGPWSKPHRQIDPDSVTSSRMSRSLVSSTRSILNFME
jgi:hypothetical protein